MTNLQEKNLLLLIGTSPIPNFVVSVYFIQNFKFNKIFLIYSEETRFRKGTLNIAENIEKLLKKKIYRNNSNKMCT